MAEPHPIPDINASSPDAILVVAAILGDLEAFGELVSRYRAAVVRLARQIAGREEAEDVAQDVFLTAFRALPGIDDPLRFGGWLMTITRHRAGRVGQQAARRRQQHQPLDALLLERLPVLQQPLAEQSAATEALYRALEQMPPEYGLPLRLRFLDEVPLRRIAAFLDVPLSTVKWRVHRGKQLLRERLQALERIPQA